jgi:hypothetical protein
MEYQFGDNNLSVWYQFDKMFREFDL